MNKKQLKQSIKRRNGRIDFGFARDNIDTVIIDEQKIKTVFPDLVGRIKYIDALINKYN